MVKIFQNLPQDAVAIRQKVFVDEQGFQDEFDEIDSIATHLVLYEENKPIATCRFFAGEEKDSFIVGRIAVVKEKRGQQIGAFMLHSAEEKIKKQNGKSVSLHAQLRAEKFYEKQGYHRYGEIGYEEFCPHIWMKKII